MISDTSYKTRGAALEFPQIARDGQPVLTLCSGYLNDSVKGMYKLFNVLATPDNYQSSWDV